MRRGNPSSERHVSDLAPPPRGGQAPGIATEHPNAERIAPELAALLADWDENADEDNYSKGEAAADLRAALRASCPACRTSQPIVHARRCPERLARNWGTSDRPVTQSEASRNRAVTPPPCNRTVAPE